MINNRQTNDIASFLTPSTMDALGTGHDNPREWLEEALDGPHADAVREAAVSAGILITEAALEWVRTSRREDRIVVVDHGDWSDADRRCLRLLADDGVDAGEVIEYWADQSGGEDDGSEMVWRIHLARLSRG